MAKLRAYFNLERVLIILAGFFLYFNTLSNDYAIDDSFVTQKGNITTQGLKAIPEILRTNYATDDTGANYDYRPVVKVSFAIEHQFFGVRPGISHLFNIIIFIFCLTLLYRLLRLLVIDPKSRAPLYIVLLFALLPIHTEVVASIKNRDILLSFAFSLMAGITVLSGKLSNKNPFIYYTLACVLLFIAFMSKLDALSFIAIIPVLVWLRFKTNFRVFAIGIAVLLAAYVITRLIVVAVSPNIVERGYCYFENPLYFNKGIGYRFIALFNTLGFYLLQFAFPFKQSCYYGANTVDVLSLSSYGIAGIAATGIIIFGFIYAWRKKNHGLLAGLFIMSACVSIFLNFVKPAVGIVADRFAFFGSLGFCMTVIFLTEPFLQRGKTPMVLKIAAGVLVLAYSFLLVTRNHEWKNSVTLIQADYKKYPESSYLNYLHATNMMDSLVKHKEQMSIEAKSSRLAEIKACLQKSVAISNDYPKAVNFLASVLTFLTKDYKEALPVIEHGLELQPKPDLLYYKAVCFNGLQQRDSTIAYLKRSIAADPGMYSAYKLLMEVYNDKGEYEKSVTLLNGALERGMQNEFVYTGLTLTYYQMYDTLGAVFYGQKALAANPRNQSVQDILGKLNALPASDSTANNK